MDLKSVGTLSFSGSLAICRRAEQRFEAIMW
jgi:hypothetical protein